MSKEKVITVKNLFKKYGDFIAVNGISFDVYRGEIFGLLGPNGAGKTTTLEIIETLRDETSGDIEVLGKSVNKDPQYIKERIGVQLQQAGFYPNTKVWEIIRLFAELYDTTADAEELLKKVDLLDKKDSKVKDLSGGQRQRFSIATTLINQPEIIFLDEPTTGLDPQARRNLWDLILDIRKSGTTVVLTTHYMDEAEYLCDRVAIMNNGQISAINSPDGLINELLSRGFKKEKVTKQASLEDVFLDLTGTKLRD
ncbi:ABC transporter ATP-binding protein [Candidatus Nomurabacteria bacterium]|nr:ABC transporter ATP-binding protein [Candidatus Nomurabacteria bacterium]MCB9803365.1 ABC transporter ATP-binding protein [Candidatus Nomurabacteria bacterium]